MGRCHDIIQEKLGSFEVGQRKDIHDRPRENVFVVAVASKPRPVAALSPVCLWSALLSVASFRSYFVCFVWFNNSSSPLLVSSRSTPISALLCSSRVVALPQK